MKRTLLLLVCLAPLLVHAQGEELENPGTVTAVQDRTFRMASELWIGIGFAPLDAFYKGITGQVGYVYHFSDTFAWQVGRGLLSYNIATGLRNQLETQFGVNPTAFPQLNWMVGSDVVWTPIYGKTSWLNSSVGHFEVYGSLGGSVVNERLGADVASGVGTTVFRPAIRLGVGVRIFSSKTISWRIDFTNDFVIYQGIEQNIFDVQFALALNFGGTE
ncbi:MAG: outer membrane beta-barrel domain-containing protein [Myxococcaceae bacterium]